MESLVLDWLGSPRVSVDGRPVRLETRKATALLALLSLERRALSREYLAALFWPEFDGVRAPANLRRTLASLRTALGGNWLECDRDTVTLADHGEIRADVAVLLSGIRKARRHHAEAGDAICDGCVDVMEEAVGLNRGEFLQGLNLRDAPEFDLWQMHTRDEVSQEVSWALERLVEVRSTAGNLEDAIELARRWLALDELHEPAHRALMLLYARNDRQSTALRQYDLCEALLSRELDQQPEAATRNLRRLILQRKLGPVDRTSPAGANSSARADNLRDPESSSPAAAGSASTDDGLSYRLRPPARRRSVVDRPHLIARLEEGTSRPFTLISAPAGFGKTTLLADWVHDCRFPAGWLSLEETENDPGRFLAGLARALNALSSEVGREAVDMMQSLRTPSPSALADSLLRDVTRLSEPGVLVLDDYHLASGPKTDAVLRDFVRRIPENLHVYLATRSDPGLPLARMRARAVLGEIRLKDLKFRSQEVKAFIEDVMELDLEDSDISLLHRRTEGWPAGLQMAALSLKDRRNRSEFISNFSGSHRHVMDYLIGEVLECQPAEIQGFLLQTSILERFCAALCDEIVGSPGSQLVLEELERSNLFIIALDDERQWYRYHHLFAELLQHRLRLASTVEEIESLHHKAGCWFENASDIETAMQHYLAGKAHHEALRVVKSHHQRILTNGGLSLLLSWMAQIPENILGDDAMSCILLGAFHAFAGSTAEAEHWLARGDSLLDQAEVGGRSEMNDKARGVGAAISAFLGEMQGRTDRAVELARKADKLLPADELMTRSLVAYILSRAYRLQGDLDRSERYLEEVISNSTESGNIWTLAGAIHEKVWNCHLRGRLQEAERVLDEFESHPLRSGTTGPIAKSIAARADLLRERGILDLALARIEEAVSAAMRWGLPSDVCFCLQTRIRIQLSTGDVSAAADDLVRVEEIVQSSQVYPSILMRHESERARILVTKREVGRALAWLEEYRCPEEAGPIDREAIDIARARVLVTGGRIPQARTLLENLAGDAQSSGRAGRLIEILILQALAAEPSEADRPLRQAIEIAEPEKYVRMFLDEGEPIVVRIRAMLGRSGVLGTRLANYASLLVGDASTT